MLAAETHKFESRYLDGLVGPWPEARATYEERSPIFHTDRIDRPLAVFQGLDDPIVPPNQAEMIVDALRPRACRSPTWPSRASSTASARASNIRAALDGELSFYAQVLGFDLPEDEGITPIEVATSEHVRACTAAQTSSADPSEDERGRGDGVRR